jgi:predicted AAA+ superfamily ATPase
MIQRPYIQIVKQRVEEKRKFIQVISGPRQVGKTTTVAQVTEAINMPFFSISADAVPATNQGWLEEQWEIARLMMAQSESSEFLLVIDEIQKIDNWSETVKSLWDNDTKENRNIKVILLGSSRLLIQQGLTESLAGRFESIYMGHWSYSEMQEAFGWNEKQFAWFGGYPGSADLIGQEERWKDYVNNALIETSISKDILMLTRVDKPALMKRLFELGCLYSGQILSYTKVMGQLLDAGNTTTLSHYLVLLDTAGLLGGIEKLSKDAIRKRSSSPKFQVHNTALISAQRNELFNEITMQPEQWGRIVESAIGAHLLNNSFSGGYKVFYWRDGNNEVDFVLEKRGKIIGLEVKSGNSDNPKGMTAFKKQCQPDKTIVVGKTGLPWAEFLKINPVELFR